MALSSLAYTDSASDGEAAVAWREVAARSAGLIALSGGPDGAADPLFAAGKLKEGRAVLAALHAAFGDRFYVELQRHGTAAEAAAEPELVGWAYENDVPLVATNDVHFVGADMASAHEALLCIADGAFMGQADRRRVTPEHRFKSAAEMREAFADLPEACDNTLDIARRCAVMVKKRDPILPRFPTGEGRSEDEELVHQAREGLDARWPARGRHPAGRAGGGLLGAAGARDRRHRAMGFPGYFLIVSDFIKWSKANGVPVGPGRGSGAGSLVAWALTDHRPRPAALRPAVRAVPEPRAGVDARLRHRLLPGGARARDLLRAGQVRPATGSPRSSPSARCRRGRCCATSAG